MSHAVVVGGSIGGLLAASALAGTYSHVTILDRDELPEDLVERRAVPQGRHVHVLLPQGCAHLESLLPGLSGQLVDAGAPLCDLLGQMRWIVNGFELARASTGLRTVVASRPFIEGHVRRRVRALPGVELVPRCEAVDLVACRGGSRVTGVRVARDGVERTLDADLVVCATGRAAQVPAWLGALGFPQPRHERMTLGIRYASRRLRLPVRALGDDRMVLVGARPGNARALGLFAQENGDWLLTLGGYGAAHRPPNSDAGFADFAATVAPPDVAQAIRDAEPLGPIATHGFPASRRWRYDRLHRFPAGLLVTGDAICSFNPLYGQGMTVAAAHALALRECLRTGDRALASRFFAAARQPTEDAWGLATAADLALPEVPGRRPPAVRAVNRYVRRMHAVAEHDPVAAAAFVEVVTMHRRPAHMLRLGLALRVAGRRLRSSSSVALPRPASVGPCPSAQSSCCTDTATAPRASALGGTS